MTVTAIVKQQKHAGGVATVKGDDTVATGVATLAERRIGAVVVSGDGKRIDGILSERDVVRVLAEKGAAALDLPVSAVMTRTVKTCSADDRIDELLTEMTQGRFRHLPVVENGEMTGIVSIGDVVAFRLAELATEKTALEDMVKGGY